MSRSAIYKAKRRVSKVNISEVEQQVISCFNKHKKNYGRIRIKKALERSGVFISECKIARIMRENGLVSKGGRKSVIANLKKLQLNI